jgi:heme exporter protein C
MLQGSRMASIMLAEMLVMALAAWLYAVAMAFIRIQAIILEREYRAMWIDQLELA